MLQFLLHGVQVALSAYALLHSSISIPNLQKYEAKSKKAAEYSSTAEKELNMTRKTQAAGAVGGILSIVSAVALAFHFVTANSFKSLFVNVFCAFATMAASMYIGDHWDGKAKVPTMSNYNSAIQSTQTTRGQLALLSMVWGATGVVELWKIFFGAVGSK